MNLPCHVWRSVIYQPPRLEELIWHRILVGGNDQDIHSQIHTIERDWPIIEVEDKKYAQRILTSLISSGLLIP